MSGIVEEEIIVDPTEVGYRIDHNDPPFDPLASNLAEESCFYNNNNSFDIEDIELSITGSIIRTNHLNQNKSDQCVVIDVKELKSEKEINDDIIEVKTEVKLEEEEEEEEEEEKEEINEKVIKIEQEKEEIVLNNLEDLEDFIKCEKIDIKKVESNQVKDEIESDIISEEDDDEEANVILNGTEIPKDEKPIDPPRPHDDDDEKDTEKEEKEIIIEPIINDSTPIVANNINVSDELDGASKTTLPESNCTTDTIEQLAENIQIIQPTEDIIITTTTNTINKSEEEQQQTASSVAVQPKETAPDGNITENEELNCEEELRSDGSDSGLGSEPSHNSSTIVAAERCSPKQSKIQITQPQKSSLKRRSSELLDGTASTSEINPKKVKRNIQFQGVTVYYFPRQQGFSCVPSQGGCSLGMSNTHNQIRYYTLTEHSAEQRKMHRLQMAEMNPRGSSSEETDSDEEPSESSSDADSEAYGFLQPISAKQRRTLLKTAGVRKIDSSEKDECRDIRSSREVCGCTCRVYCDPETCSCSQGGIKCQVDRQSFPCGCTRDGCGNVVGRVEFNPVRVRTHYIHTVMRLEMEKKQEKIQIATPDYLTQQQQHQHQQQQQQWRVPAQNMSMCDFNLLYNNSQQSTQPATVGDARNNRSSTVQPESLDLHYAYRDDYSPATTYPSTIYDPCSYPSTSTAPYMETTSVVEQQAQVPFDTGHYPVHSYTSSSSSQQQHHQQQQQDTRVPNTYEQYNYYESQSMSTTTTPSIPLPTQTKSIENQPPSETPQIPQNSYINLGGQITNPARLDAINNLLENNRFNSALPVSETQNEQQQQTESNENLSEIIKNSIVETVSV